MRAYHSAFHLLKPSAVASSPPAPALSFATVSCDFGKSDMYLPSRKYSSSKAWSGRELAASRPHFQASEFGASASGSLGHLSEASVPAGEPLGAAVLLSTITMSLTTSGCCSARKKTQPPPRD